MSQYFSASSKLILLIVLAFIVDYLPFVNLPFLWSETFFHEISHGMAALLTGGDIVSISLDYSGAGLCVYTGGIKSIVSFSGYAGSGIWGLLIYSSVADKTNLKASTIAIVLVLIILTVLILWTDNIPSRVILLILVSMYIGVFFKRQVISLRLLIQFVGVFVMLDAIRSPLYLLDGRNLGDGAQLSQLTWLPEIVWVVIWVAISVACLSMAWRMAKQNGDKRVMTSSTL